jgi:benzodiazapine receptor
MNSKLLAALNLIALTIVLTVNALANILPINGMNTGEISALYPSLFTPAGFTFSIWSIIYLLLIAFAIVQWKFLSTSYFTELSLWFLLSSFANVSWILSWHYLFVYASVLIMMVLLFSLTKIFLLLHSAKLKSLVERAFIKLPFIFYFSWICVATIANISTLLVSLSWEGGFLSPVIWTMTMITIASALGIFISRRFREPSFLLVLIWALYGIYSKWHGTENNQIAETALIELIVLAVLYLIFLLTQRMPNLFVINKRKLFQ